MRIQALTVLSLLVASASAIAQDAPRRPNRQAYPPEMPDARTEVYKTVGDTKLSMYVYVPEGAKPSDKAPAIVFFFGGGWQAGSPAQFLPQCKYFASRGMVAMAADYRVASRHGVKAVECVKDAKSAIRWVRANADRLGVDPNRIVAAGGSAGGHLAAATGTLDGFDEPGEDNAISSRPNALVLFNPALVLAPVAGVKLNETRTAGLAQRMGTKPQDVSPYHHISKSTPPTAIFHGEADTTVPFATAAAFTDRMQAAGNTCQLFGYPGEGHGFFNYGRGKGTMFAAVLTEADKFLAGLGYISGEPTVATFLKTFKSE